MDLFKQVIEIHIQRNSYRGHHNSASLDQQVVDTRKIQQIQKLIRCFSLSTSGTSLRELVIKGLLESLLDLKDFKTRQQVLDDIAINNPDMPADLKTAIKETRDTLLKQQWESLFKQNVPDSTELNPDHIKGVLDILTKLGYLSSDGVLDKGIEYIKGSTNPEGMRLESYVTINLPDRGSIILVSPYEDKAGYVIRVDNPMLKELDSFLVDEFILAISKIELNYLAYIYPTHVRRYTYTAGWEEDVTAAIRGFRSVREELEVKKDLAKIKPTTTNNTTYVDIELEKKFRDITEYIKTHGIRPSRTSKDPSTSKLGEFVQSYLPKKKNSNYYKNLTHEVREELNYYLKMLDDEYIQRFVDIIEYIKYYEYRPSTTDKNLLISKLGRLLSNYLINKDNPEHYKILPQEIKNRLNAELKKLDEKSIQRFVDITEYIKTNGIRPSASNGNPLIRKLGELLENYLRMRGDPKYYSYIPEAIRKGLDSELESISRK